jgi:hypothetical protein
MLTLNLGRGDSRAEKWLEIRERGFQCFRVNR